MAESRNPFMNSFISVDHSLDIDDDSSTAFSDDSVTADDHDIESGEMDSSKNNSSLITTNGWQKLVSNWSVTSDIDKSTRTCPAQLNSSAVNTKLKRFHQVTSSSSSLLRQKFSDIRR
jgi:hypothetical protein